MNHWRLHRRTVSVRHPAWLPSYQVGIIPQHYIHGGYGGWLFTTRRIKPPGSDWENPERFAVAFPMILGESRRSARTPRPLDHVWDTCCKVGKATNHRWIFLRVPSSSGLLEEARDGGSVTVVAEGPAVFGRAR